MVESTSASRPASNLIPKHLISHPPAGAYAAMTIKKRVGRTTLYSPALFFYIQSHLRIPACLEFKRKTRKLTFEN